MNTDGDAAMPGMQQQMAAARAIVAARTLAGMGYAVFPCGRNKRPAIPKAAGGNGYKDGTTDWGAIQAMWARWPGELVGVATGEMSGIAVVDVDTKHDTAREWWIANRARLLPARVHCTQSGGRHVIYRHRPGLTCSASKIARGVDVRADGGYVIWWPAAGLPVLQDSGIRPWPEWLMQLLEPVPVPAPAVSIARAVRDGDLRPMLHRAGGVLRTLVNAHEGERNRILFWAACRVRDMYQTNVLDHAASMQMIELLRAAADRAGLPQRETERTIVSAFRARAA
jgi:hypothetical protein